MILIFSTWVRTGLSPGDTTIFWDAGKGKIPKFLSSAMQVNTLPSYIPIPTPPCLAMGLFFSPLALLRYL